MSDIDRKKRLRRQTWRLLGFGLLLSLALHIVFLSLAGKIPLPYSVKEPRIETIEIDLQTIDPQELKDFLESRYPAAAADAGQEKIVSP